MIAKILPRTLMVAFASAGFALSLPAAAEVDVAAAELLYKQSECGKCHHATQNKKGPGLRKISREYKGKPDGEKEIIKHLTTPKKVKLDDGSEEDHKIVDSKDPKAIANLAKWILNR